MNEFTHLHVHTEYSLLDGAAKIKPLVKRAAELGFKSLAVTDHGVMYGAVEFYEEAKKEGIKPIIGCEVYTAPNSRHGRVHGVDSEYGHLVLLCKNEKGYKNLMTLVSYAFTEGFYYKPRVDKELLKKYSDGLIALSGCLKGEVSACLVSGDYERAIKKAEEYAKIFGKENFYLEIQNHGLEEQKIVIDGMIKISSELGLKIVATNDVHYITKDDSVLQDILTCIQTGKKLSDTDRMKFFGQEFYLKSEEEMKKLFSYVPDALQNTAEIAEKCNLEIDFNTVHLPKIEIETELSHSDYLKKLCFEGAEKKYGNLNPKITERLNYELDVINKMGYTDYFLIVWDLIRYAKSKKISIGPGRGSAAGSIVAYSLDITEIDPLEYDLLFERFLNPERVSMPDIDIDICNERRDELKAYVIQKYGKNRVSGIAAFGTFAARAAIRDVGRVLGTEPATVDKTAKMIPEKPHITIKDVMKPGSELERLYNTDINVKKLVDIAMRLEGFVRHVTTHAAGVVIADDELNAYTPVQIVDTGLLSQYPMSSLEKIGLLKMDFLGLRNLTVIDNTVDLVKKTQGINIDIQSLNYSDKKTFELIQRGDTDGVFQLENPGLKTFLRKFKPSSLNDIIITTSINRPGPMEHIPEFLENLKNPEKTVYPHPLLKDILKPTNGVIIYQEQVMSIVKILAGYSMGRADIVRRAMAKKKMAEMEKERLVFINGLTDEDGSIIIPGTKRNGIDEKEANKIFDLLIDFANYAFNKSHAACYANLAYRTAYLKANYPTQYLCALLTSFLGNLHKTAKYVNSFSKYGIRLLPPDINKSGSEFMPEGRDVRFGLSALKNVGISFPESIVIERSKRGDFKSLDDFINRMSSYELNRKSVEVLVKSGAFDSLSSNRKVLALNVDTLVDAIHKDGFGKTDGQVSFFAEDDFKSVITYSNSDVADYTFAEKLEFEYELAGMYLSGHPMNEYLICSAAFSDTQIYSINDGSLADGAQVKTCAAITSLSVRRTKNGVFICTVTLSDLYDSIELVSFENTYMNYSDILKVGAVLAITAKVRKRDDSISLSLIAASDASAMVKDIAGTLYIRLSDIQYLGKTTNVLSRFKGDAPVCIYFEDSGNMVKSDSSHGCKLCNELIKTLSDIIGIENIKIK